MTKTPKTKASTLARAYERVLRKKKRGSKSEPRRLQQLALF